MSRLDDLKKRHEKLSAKAGLSASGGGRPAAPRRAGIVIKIAPGVVLLAALILGGLVWLRGRDGSGSDERLAAAGEKYRQAVGLVVATGRDASGAEVTVPLATAWSYLPGLAATNAHVAMQARELAAAGADISIVVNGRPDLVLKVVGAVPHAQYRGGGGEADSDGDDSPLGLAFDLALLVLEGDFPVQFPVADAAELARIKSGYRVAYLGFPMENLLGGNVDPANPVATMQSGIVTATSDFGHRDAGSAGNVLIRHNLGVAGGASGSPLFNAKGQVVGVVNGMNVASQVLAGDDGQPELGRTPSAAMVNFAQRIDLVVAIAAGRRPALEQIARREVWDAKIVK